MDRSLAEKARARRRAALSALAARLAADDAVVSIFEGTFVRRRETPEFRSVRRHDVAGGPQALPVLLLRNRIAA